MTKTKAQGLARVLESIDTEALKAAAVGDKVAVKIYDAIYELLTVSAPNTRTKNHRAGMRLDGRPRRQKQ